MATKPSPDGRGIICDFSRQKCEIHGGKLRECGCHPIWADRDWMEERMKTRARRLGRLMRRKHDERFALEFAHAFVTQLAAALKTEKPE